ncbi:hypothetical protein [Moritella sp. Urea-trap-13]|uniref:hypothetical protein n=1 Tax=Moritella sp. Urea-trap-13 TaxID=2058327 RepID=UPI000C31F82A|nr:hypothetical protein [Moritella sp. Urea-trap-13]PKH05502.1 hypothetical protein CXF93_17680 [Moritella sp. Urea-trap-13]
MIAISIKKNIRFKIGLMDLIDQYRGNESFSRFVKNAVIMSIRAKKMIAENEENANANPNTNQLN